MPHGKLWGIFNKKGGKVVAKDSERKCGTCGKIITINRHSIDNIVYYQTRYHHLDCFVEKVKKGANAKRNSAHWKEVLNNIQKLQEDAKNKLKHPMIRDEFNNYLIEQYDVSAISGAFWTVVEDIGNGIYKRKKCRPIDMDTILQTWKWGQKHLDKIAANNKAKNRGPINGSQRLPYDLAIVLQHVDDYKKHITETKEQKEVIAKHIETSNKINYEQLYAQSNNQNRSESIIDLMNDIF